MDHRGETRVVIGGNLADFAGLFSLGIDLGIGSSHEPEHRRHMPFRPEAAKVLARRGRLRLLDTFRGKMASKGIGDTPGCLRIVPDKSITVEDRDLRLFRRARGFRLGVDNTLDCAEDSRSNALVEGADIQLDDCLVGYDVFLGAGLERPDGDDGRVRSRNLARYDGL